MIGALLVVRGLIGMAMTGFQSPFTPGGDPFLGMQLSPAVDLALILVGYLMVDGLPRLERSGSTRVE